MSYLTLLLPQNPAAVVSINELGETEKRSPLQCFCLPPCWTGQQSLLHREKIPATLENRRPRPRKSRAFGPVAKTETWQTASYENDTNLCSHFRWIKKKQLIFQVIFLVTNWKLPALQEAGYHWWKGRIYRQRFGKFEGSRALAQDFCVFDLQWCLS